LSPLASESAFLRAFTMCPYIFGDPAFQESTAI
jgi:hypothetical protein